MALIYSATGSLDGYLADPDGNFDFAFPDEELHAFVNQVFARMRTILTGRRSYELMDVWDSADLDSLDPIEAEFARGWRASDKVVYSRTLASVSHPRTRLERDFDPVAVREIVESGPGDVGIGGATLAAEGFRAGLVDEVWAFLMPVTVGAGLPMFPTDQRLMLELIDQHRFGNGAVGLHYRITR